MNDVVRDLQDSTRQRVNKSGLFWFGMVVLGLGAYLLLTFLFALTPLGELGTIGADVTLGVIYFVAALPIMARHHDGMLASMGSRKRPLGVMDIGVLVVSSIAVYLLTQFCTGWIFSVVKDSARLDQANTLNSISPITLIVITVFIAPIGEEVLFRGWIMGSCKQKLGPTFAVFIQAFVFALFHGSESKLYYTFVLALFLGFVATYTGRLWICMLLHALYNWFALFWHQPAWAMGFNSNTWWIVLLGVAGVFAIIAATYRFVDRDVDYWCRQPHWYRVNGEIHL